MSNLKELTLNGLSELNTKNFNLDLAIIENVNITKQPLNLFCAKHGISGMKFAGRKTSLIKRGHLLSQAQTEALKEGKNIPTKGSRKVVKKTNPYNNADGLNKEVARNKMAKYIIDADVEGTILTLPYSTCAIEKKILVDAPNTTFLGVEMDKSTYVDLNATVRSENLPIETYNGMLSDKIYGENEDTYSNITADFCGGLGKFGKEIEYAVTNKIVKRGGIMALTFSKPIRGGKQADELLALGGTITNNVNDNRCKSDKAFEAFFNRICGTEFEFLEIFNYKDDKKDAKGTGFPMVLIILKRK